MASRAMWLSTSPSIRRGKVAELAVLHTLGYGIESSVIGTLKTWTFRPATKDGNPIASVQELHFHFGPV